MIRYEVIIYEKRCLPDLRNPFARIECADQAVSQRSHQRPNGFTSYGKNIRLGPFASTISTFVAGVSTPSVFSGIRKSINRSFTATSGSGLAATLAVKTNFSPFRSIREYPM
jgi:hypothetical protein